MQRRAERATVWDIAWAPDRLSASFHGRDLFVPVAAMLARGNLPPGQQCRESSNRRLDWPDDLTEIVYIDRYGNAMTGLRAAEVAMNAQLAVGDRVLLRGRTFSDVAVGEAFWYENSNRLVEIAVNQGRADRDIEVRVGTPFQVLA
jgi:S-adenosylmethionine hydrolase